MNEEFHFFPEQASTFAGPVDALYAFLLTVATFFTILIATMIWYFAFKYRRGARVDRSQRHSRGTILLEVTWSLIPLGLTMIMFAWGAEVFFRMRQPPPDAIEIDVVAKQWMWKIHHPEGNQEIDELHVPVGQPVRLRMISEDVIHSFYIPAFRVKSDVLPGKYNRHLWFQATKTGEYNLFCAEYCGTSHSGMIGKVVVMEPADYANWLRGASHDPPEVAGEKLFTRLQCNTCHQNAPNARAPSLAGVYGSTVTLRDGRQVVADEAYIRESIYEPNAKVVAGYQPVMPTYQGKVGDVKKVNEEQILQIIAYLKSLGGPRTAGQ